MNTRRLIALAGSVAALLLALFLAVDRRAPLPAPASDAGPAAAEPMAADSVWYHASDVALLGATGRPQLVEFFHPD